MVLIGAGLPTLPRLAGEAKSYAERLFFRVRFDRLTDGEKRFMRAMAERDDSGCQVGNGAQLLGVKNTAVSLTRSNLIRKGMIYSPRHGVIDYSVPVFGDFLRRVIPEFTPGTRKSR